jgi:flavin reductase (DIM6/NTAB) family NADH-FMN oxidoreductase RutF
VQQQWAPEPVGVSEGEFRSALAEFTAGVTVVTTVWQGMPHAMTATAFSSVSLSPPLVLVCVGKRSRFHHAVTQAGTWAVSILEAAQVGLARHFGHSGRDLATQFDGVPTFAAPYSVAPVLVGVPAWLDCATFGQHDAGDHTIVVGKVIATGLSDSATAPLTYHRGTYT